MSFNEEDRVRAQLRGGEWRRLEPPQMVSCYVASIWRDASATDINDETREIRVEYPAVTADVRRIILNVSEYQPSTGLFPMPGSEPVVPPDNVT